MGVSNQHWRAAGGCNSRARGGQFATLCSTSLGNSEWDVVVRNALIEIVGRRR